MYERSGNTFSHYDSYGGSNREAASAIVRKVSPFINRKLCKLRIIMYSFNACSIVVVFV